MSFSRGLLTDEPQRMLVLQPGRKAGVGLSFVWKVLHPQPPSPGCPALYSFKHCNALLEMQWPKLYTGF